MNKTTLILAVATAFLTSCQSKSNNASESSDSVATLSADNSPNGKACYSYIKNKDTITLNMAISGDSVSGELIYNFYEKDKNSGAISGIAKGDTIIADYTFRSEGIQSQREVVFLKKDDKLLEGTGEQSEVNGKQKFKDLNKVSFNNSIALISTDCK